MSKIELILKDISDEYVRENFSRLIAFLGADNVRRTDFKFYEITFQAAASGVKYAHRLGYVPKDIIVTNITNQENVLFNTDQFDRTNFDMDVTGACTVRFFAGRYEES